MQRKFYKWLIIENFQQKELNSEKNGTFEINADCKFLQ